jgi:hypothetical protein
MPLYIFLCDKVLLYFIVRIEVIKIQIWFEFKLVCNLQKGLKIYKGFSIFLRRIGPNPSIGPASLLPRANRSAQLASASGPANYRACPTPVALTRPILVKPDPIARQPDPNLSSYPLRRFI